MKYALLACLVTAIVLCDSAAVFGQSAPQKPGPGVGRPPGGSPPAQPMPQKPGPGVGLPPGDNPAAGPGRPAPGTVKVSPRRDRLILTDGKVIEGCIVAAGSNAVVIVTPDGELTVPRSKIEHLERGLSGSEMLLPRSFETEVVDGHERIVVPPGFGDELGKAPPGVIPPGGEQQKTVGLRYKLRKGDTIAAVIDASEKQVENLPGKDQAAREEKIRLALTTAVSGAAADGTCTVDATFKLRSLMRDGADVTALDEKLFDAVHVVRSLSAAGHWQPGADTVTGAPEHAGRFARWLAYLTVPLPARPVALGSTMKADDVMPPALASLMLAPPEHVTVPNWRVTGKYVVSGTADLAGTNCAIIAVDLEAAGSGVGVYAETIATLDVKATSHWDIYFGIAEGRPVRCQVKTSTLTTGQIGDEPLKCTTELAVNVQAAAPVRPPKEPTEVQKPPRPDKPAADIDKALDDLMKRINDPRFFEERL